MMSQLAVDQLHAYYGKSHILHGVTFELEPQTITSLIGRNGSGRSTLLKSLMGILRPARGAITFDKTRIFGLPTHRIAREGLAYVPEDRLVFPHLTVAEPGRRSAGNTAWRTSMVGRRYVCLFPRLKERRDQRAGTLSGGEQQMLTLCRSLMGNPKLILIDEPTEGLAPAIVEQLREILVDIRRRRRINSSRRTKVNARARYQRLPARDGQRADRLSRQRRGILIQWRDSQKVARRILGRPIRCRTNLD